MKKTAKSSINIALVFFLSLIITASGNLLHASDLSTAQTLRERCEKEIKVLEVAVTNFGTDSIRQEFQKGERNLKLAKVKYIQTKYTEAIDLYNEFLKMQHNMYRDLAALYIERTGKLIDDIGVELVDFVDDKKIEKYFQLASQNLKDAKNMNSTQHYKQALDYCRQAKNYAISAYEVAGKKAPEQYTVDIRDNNLQTGK